MEARKPVGLDSTAPDGPDTFNLAGQPVPRVVLGTAGLGSILPDGLGSAARRAEGFVYLDRMLELGCTAFDLAASYQLGGAERLVGRWMQARRHRERLFLITKGGHPYPLVQPHRLGAKALSDDLHGSLRRLRTERVDLYLLHRDDPAAALEPLLQALVGHQREGKIGAFGVSNWTHQRVRALAELARSSGLPTPLVSSPQFSLVDWLSPPWKGCVSISGDRHRAARAYYAEAQLPVLGWSALGSGFLAPRAPAARTLRLYGSRANFERRSRAESLGQRYRLTLAQVALAYLFSQPFPVLAVVSAGSFDDMRANLRATKQRLPPSEVRWLEAPDAPPGS